ncbi:hypothetical protein PGQ11_009259 [Apiospora arundinis]|uniref:Myb-like DNA-binding domain-containing protein n=1 Tax=Apiospora arundinis TaxID=335852 RepID=A0ABR2IHH9_9PEZI
MSNNDNAMTRFLFAILKQKNLKDIDWNAVARDPILSQEITNGHAARMRYSRFRQAMLGLEPKPRNKVVAEKDKHRITKSKKAPKTKREEIIKSESAVTKSNATGPSEPPTPRIKQEMAPSPFDSRLTPGPVSAASSPAMPHVIQPRLLTPCSDTDGFSTTQGLTPSPAPDMFTSQPPFDFATSHYGHETTAWPAGPMFPSFHTTFEFDPINLTCGYSHTHPHGEAPNHSHEPAENEEGMMGVKHEIWDDNRA